MQQYSIGQLAKRAGVAVDTVRCYERSRLLVPAARLRSGYRRSVSVVANALRLGRV